MDQAPPCFFARRHLLEPTVQPWCSSTVTGEKTCDSLIETLHSHYGAIHGAFELIRNCFCQAQPAVGPCILYKGHQEADAGGPPGLNLTGIKRLGVASSRPRGRPRELQDGAASPPRSGPRGRASQPAGPERKETCGETLQGQVRQPLSGRITLASPRSVPAKVYSPAHHRLARTRPRTV